jgi:hypothetical protein
MPCKTVGSAYDGSNPSPATTCENAPGPAGTTVRRTPGNRGSLSHEFPRSPAPGRIARTYDGPASGHRRPPGSPPPPRMRLGEPMPDGGIRGDDGTDPRHVDDRNGGSASGWDLGRRAWRPTYLPQPAPRRCRPCRASPRQAAHGRSGARVGQRRPCGGGGAGRSAHMRGRSGADRAPPPYRPWARRRGRRQWSHQDHSIAPAQRRRQTVEGSHRTSGVAA